MSYPVPGPPASVLAAISRQDPAHPYNPAHPRQRRYAWISPYGLPWLPSLVTDEVFMPQYALLDANVTATGSLATQGLTGATAASRYAGATASGAPASGTFAAGDFVIDQSGNIWVCTAAGTPGTWTGTATAAAPITDWRNAVTQYGADPTGAADSTTAIQAAITAAAGAGIVYLPAGTYKLSAALAMGSGVILQGDGPAATILNQTSTTANAVTISGTTVLNPAIRDLRINGPGSGSGIGIAASASSGANPVVQADLRNLIVYAMGGSGMDLLVPIVSRLDNIECVSNGGSGFYLHGGGTSCTLTGCYANTNTGRGYYLDSMFYTALTGCAADGNALGYEIAACDSVSLTSCGAEVTLAAGGLDGTSFKISAASSNCGLHNCRAFKNAAVGAWITGSSFECQILGFTETATGTPTASLKVDSGSGATVGNYVTATGQSFASDSVTILNSYGYTLLRSPEFGGTATCDAGLNLSSQKITSLANGSNPQDAAAFGQIVQLDGTASDIQPVAAAASAGSTGKAADAGHAHMGMSLLATTGVGGFALANSTNTVLTWTAPSDGNMHRILLIANLYVTTLEAGGKMTWSNTPPGGVALSGIQVFAGAQAAGFNGHSTDGGLVEAGTTVTVQQFTALTSGAATFWCELWGS